MFGIWKRKPKVLEHWYSLVEFQISTAEFYDAIEQQLQVRELTGLEISRIEYAEGGVLSAKRQYLRMRRERLLFDVCSAPFGKTWFFSCRYSILPCELGLWEYVLILLPLAVVSVCYLSVFGLFLGSVLVGASLLSLLIFMRNTVKLGFHDFDAALLQIPVFGVFYEEFLRPETYYREDTRLAYAKIVDTIVKEKVDEVTKANGIELVNYFDAKPPSHPALLSMVADLLSMGQKIP